MSNNREGAEGAADLGDIIPGAEVDPSDTHRSSDPTGEDRQPADGQERAAGPTPIRSAGSTPFTSDSNDLGPAPLAGGDSGGDLDGRHLDGGDLDGSDLGTDDLQDGAPPADDAGSQFDEADGSLAAVGSTAGSARAAARRSAVRAGVTEKKGRATVARDDSVDRRPNVLARISRYLREVVGELRKVIWPGRNQMVTYTLVVIVFVVFMVALVYALDLLFAKGVLTIFG